MLLYYGFKYQCQKNEEFRTRDTQTEIAYLLSSTQNNKTWLHISYALKLIIRKRILLYTKQPYSFLDPPALKYSLCVSDPSIPIGISFSDSSQHVTQNIANKSSSEHSWKCYVCYKHLNRKIWWQLLATHFCNIRKQANNIHYILAFLSYDPTCIIILYFILWITL